MLQKHKSVKDEDEIADTPSHTGQFANFRYIGTMTKEQKMKLIETYYKAFNEQKPQGMLDCLHDDIHHDMNQGTTQVGKQKFAQFLDHMNVCYREKLKDVVIMASENVDKAAASFIVDGVYLKTDGSLPPAQNQKYEIKAGTFFEFKNNLISRVTTYYNLPEWINLVK